MASTAPAKTDISLLPFFSNGPANQRHAGPSCDADTLASWFPGAVAVPFLRVGLGTKTLTRGISDKDAILSCGPAAAWPELRVTMPPTPCFGRFLRHRLSHVCCPMAQTRTRRPRLAKSRAAVRTPACAFLQLLEFRISNTPTSRAAAGNPRLAAPRPLAPPARGFALGDLCSETPPLPCPSLFSRRVMPWLLSRRPL